MSLCRMSTLFLSLELVLSPNFTTARCTFSLNLVLFRIVRREGDWDSLISPSSETPTLSPPSHSHPVHVTPPPSYLKDFYYYSTTSHSSSHSYPFFDVLGYAKLFSSHHALINVISSHVGPTFFSQAIVIPKWNQAMQAELQALEQNKTWSLTTFPPSTSCGLQVDVNNAFLHDDLAKGVNMCLPLGYHHKKEQLTSNIVCRSHKSIYGLKQAFRQWFAKFSSVLLEERFTQSATDHSLYIKHEGFLASKLASTLIEAKVKLFQDDEELLEDLGLYRHLIGKLLYLTIT
ncbi:hypothetical protein CK203_042812 [Vitis vinifera]|uniref:Reverse transcriptase Ty1/copia-type domain-containing protein n=1 Tax=Vitis vinifera TaxID=29760 RepID=A0A438HQM5_VITVI|nr:hypothetical protein CK203_042812 [Vitis vinifera]